MPTKFSTAEWPPKCILLCYIGWGQYYDETSYMAKPIGCRAMCISALSHHNLCGMQHITSKLELQCCSQWLVVGEKIGCWIQTINLSNWWCKHLPHRFFFGAVLRLYQQRSELGQVRRNFLPQQKPASDTAAEERSGQQILPPAAIWKRTLSCRTSKRRAAQQDAQISPSWGRFCIRSPRQQKEEKEWGGSLQINMCPPLPSTQHAPPVGHRHCPAPDNKSGGRFRSM